MPADISRNLTVTTHQHNLQLLLVEIYKTKHSLNPTFMRDVFAERNNKHNLRNENHLRLPVAKATTYGLEILNTEAVFCGPHCHQKLKIPNPYLNSNGRSKNRMEILASVDDVKFMLEI